MNDVANSMELRIPIDWILNYANPFCMTLDAINDVHNVVNYYLKNPDKGQEETMSVDFLETKSQLRARWEIKEMILDYKSELRNKTS